MPGESEEAQTIQELQKSLEKVEKSKSSEEVKKSSAMSRFQRFLENVDQTESKIGKTIKGIRDGVEIAQKLAGHYNDIASWCGLPTVPKPFLKKD